MKTQDKLKNKFKDKPDLVKFWRWSLLGYMMLAWIVLKYYMRMSEWVLIPAFFAYLIVSALVCRHYVTGMIGNFYYFIRKPDKAMHYYTKAVKHNTRNVKALYNYALDSLHNGNGAEALPVLERAEQINTKILFAKLIPLAKSSCYWVMGNIDKAIEILEKLIHEYDYINPSTYTTLGYFYMLKEDYTKAEEFTQKALKDNGEYAPAWDNMGQLEYLRGNREAAEENFRKALEYRESMPESLYYLGKIEAEKGNKKAALEYLEKAAGCYISSMSTVTKEMIDAEIKKLNN